MIRQNQTSLTAFNVICALTKLDQIPRWKNYFPEGISSLNRSLINSCKDNSYKYFLAGLPSWLYIQFMENIFVTGMTYHFLFRKLYIEAYSKASLNEGTQQIIVIGGGLDSLAIRLAKEHSYLKVFEIDIPYTQEQKIFALEKIYYNIPENFTFIPADLSDISLEEALLKAKEFSQSKPTLIILEGVLMYLTKNEVIKFFAEARALFHNKLSIIFGAIVQPDEQAGKKNRIMDIFLSKRGEGTKWFCRSSDMSNFVKKLGFNLQRHISYKDLQRRYRDEKEIRNVPEEDENYYIIEKIT